MIVVADSSPLIVLVNIGHVDVLPRLFGQVLIPSEVLSELRSSKRTAAVQQFIRDNPAWLIERQTQRHEVFPRLDTGESAAINLALELGAGALLIDELRGRKAATERNLVVTGTLGVLELAAAKGMVELADAFDRLAKTDFWVSKDLLETRLKAFRDSRGRS